MSELQIVPAGELPEIEGLRRLDVPAIWNEYHEQATSLKTTAQTLVVKDVKDLATMKLARDTRLALRSIRCESLEAAARDREERLATEMKKVEREARKLHEAAEEERLAEEAEKARVQAERIAALKAPDKEKLLAYAAAVRAIELPRMATATGDDVVELIAAQATKFASWVEAKAATL